jgi:hypothetical protein
MVNIIAKALSGAAHTFHVVELGVMFATTECAYDGVVAIFRLFALVGAAPETF